MVELEYGESALDAILSCWHRVHSKLGKPVLILPRQGCRFLLDEFLLAIGFKRGMPGASGNTWLASGTEVAGFAAAALGVFGVSPGAHRLAGVSGASGGGP